MCKDDMIGYRYLEIGELVETGDEMRVYVCDGIWMPTSLTTEGRRYVDCHMYKRYRRKFKVTENIELLNEKVEDLIEQVKEIKEAQNKSYASNEKIWWIDEGYLYYKGFKWRRLKVGERIKNGDVCLREQEAHISIIEATKEDLYCSGLGGVSESHWRVKWEAEEKQWRDVVEGEIIQEGFEGKQWMHGGEWLKCQWSIGYIIASDDIKYFRSPKDLKPIFNKEKTIEVPVSWFKLPLSCGECGNDDCQSKLMFGSDHCLRSLFLDIDRKVQKLLHELKIKGGSK